MKENKREPIRGRGIGEKEFFEKFAKLAASYTPEWNFDRESPDAGTVIAEVYAKLYGENRSKYFMAPENFRIELANIMGVGLKKAVPARTAVSLDIAENTVDGVYVDKETKLQAWGKQGLPVIFQTESSIYVTASKLRDIWFSSESQGKIYHLLSHESEIEKEIVYGLEDEKYDNGSAFVLIHPYVFRTFPGQEFRFDFDGEVNGNHPLLSDPNCFVWYYETRSGWLPFLRKEGNDREIILSASERNIPFIREGEPCYRICCAAAEPIREEVKITGVSLRSSSNQIVADEVWVGDIQQEVSAFYPFGEALTLYSECCISCEQVMSMRGADIKVQFNLSFEEVCVEQDTEDTVTLKPIMRKPRKVQLELTDVRAEEVIFEYFNGIGWSRLRGDGLEKSLFADGEDRVVTMKFPCPEDAEPIAVNAGEAIWLRMRLIRADGCFMPNTRHFVPMIRDLMLEYQCEHTLNENAELYQEFEFEYTNQTKEFTQQRSVSVFKPVSLGGENLLLGFDQNFLGSPISLAFDVEESNPQRKRKIKVEYSTLSQKKKFSHMDVMDLTDGLTHSGKIIFTPPVDFHKKEIFKTERYWLKISLEGEDGILGEKVQIRRILINSVDVKNVEMLPPRLFYADSGTARDWFYLGTENILEALIYVDEASSLSQLQMERMLEEGERDIQYVADKLGNITECFVAWNETESFRNSEPRDRHYVIDRVNNTLIFPDGKRGKALPKQRGTTIKAIISVCVGKEGNVPAGAILETYENLPFIGSISNAIAANGGGDMEELQDALNRAPDLILRKGRVISQSDFEKEAKSVSGNITRVKYIKGINGFGKVTPSGKVMAVLMNDYDRTEMSFWHVKHEIEKTIAQKCQYNLMHRGIQVVQPMRIRINGTLTIHKNEAHEGGFANRSIIEAVKNFLNPIRGNFNGKGWDIGKLPSPEHLLLYLKSINHDWDIKNIMLTGTMETPDGKKELDLYHEQNLPLAMGISGTHHIKWIL